MRLSESQLNVLRNLVDEMTKAQPNSKNVQAAFSQLHLNYSGQFVQDMQTAIRFAAKVQAPRKEAGNEPHRF